MGDVERLDLNEVARGLDSAKLAEVADFIGYLKTKQEGELDLESHAWLDADLSRLGEVEPYEWGAQDPLAGDPVYWDEEHQALMVATNDQAR